MEESSSKNSTSFVLQTLDQRKKEGSNTIERYNEKINLNFKKLSRILGHTYKSIQQAKVYNAINVKFRLSWDT